MKRRSFLLSAATLMAMSLLGSAVQGAIIPVQNDTGTLGAFRLTNLGISGGVSHLELDLTTPAGEQVNTINGAAVTGITAAFTQPIFMDVTGSAPNYSITLTGGTYTKTFFNPNGSSAQLSWNLTSGVTLGAPFFNLTGKVTSVITDGLTGYTFSPFVGGQGGNSINLTATAFGGGASSFDTVISTPGGTAFATGTGLFSETAPSVPEPGSLALLGVGITGLLTVRRFLKGFRV
jgi:hypothetical protein